MDGTSCDDEGRRICVDGECMPVGCDGNLGSNTEVIYNNDDEKENEKKKS